MGAADLKPGLQFFNSSMWYLGEHYIILKVEGGMVQARCLDLETFGSVLEVSVEKFLYEHQPEPEVEPDVHFFTVQGIDDEYDACLKGWSKRQDQIFGQVGKEIEAESPPLLSDSDRDLIEDLFEEDVPEEFDEFEE